MKNALLIFALAFAAAHANASHVESYDGNLTQFFMQQGSHLQDATSGTVKVTPTRNIVLTIAVPNAKKPFVIEVPVVSRTTGGCHEEIYIGQVDQRPVDGNMTKVTVIDNSQNFCEFILPGLTEVKLEFDAIMRGTGHFHEEHTMYGDLLTQRP